MYYVFNTKTYHINAQDNLNIKIKFLLNISSNKVNMRIDVGFPTVGY